MRAKGNKKGNAAPEHRKASTTILPRVYGYVKCGGHEAMRLSDGKCAALRFLAGSAAWFRTVRRDASAVGPPQLPRTHHP